MTLEEARKNAPKTDKDLARFHLYRVELWKLVHSNKYGTVLTDLISVLGKSKDYWEGIAEELLKEKENERSML